MTLPLKNIIYDKIKEVRSVTDTDLYKTLTKGGLTIADDRYNKILLDLEILGLIKVAWLTKDERRIEVAEERAGAIEEHSKKETEKDYEASFPGFEK